MLTLRYFFTSGEFSSKQGRNLRSESGLTLTETFVTMAILSMIIVLSLALIIFIGRVYNRGIQTNKLQNVTNTITTHISETIRTSGVQVQKFDDPTWSELKSHGVYTGGYDDDWFGYCIGDTQYSYRLNTQLIADESKTEPQAPSQAAQALIVSRACNPDTTDANPNLLYFAGPDSDFSRVDDNIEQFELLHDRMRILGFSIDQVGEYDNLYDIRLKLAIGGDAADRQYDAETFEFIEHPCEHPTLGSSFDWNLRLVFEGTCESDKNEWVPVTTPAGQPGVWQDPMMRAPQGENNLPHIIGATIEKREVIIHKCEGAATLCGVMETRTRVFRRVF